MNACMTSTRKLSHQASSFLEFLLFQVFQLTASVEVFVVQPLSLPKVVKYRDLFNSKQKQPQQHLFTPYLTSVQFKWNNRRDNPERISTKHSTDNIPVIPMSHQRPTARDRKHFKAENDIRQAWQALFTEFLKTSRCALWGLIGWEKWSVRGPTVHPSIWYWPIDGGTPR